MTRLRAVVTLIALCATSPVAAQDAAQAPDAEDPATGPGARGAGASDAAYEQTLLRAVEAFEAGAWVEAHALFSDAHRLHPTARTLRTMGMASYNQGNYVRALRELRAALHGQDKPLTKKQRAHVLDLIARAEARTASIGLSLQPPEATVLLDGRPAHPGEDGRITVTPGPHEITARADGFETARASVQAEAGQQHQLSMTLRPQQTSAAAPAPTRSAVASAPVADRDRAVPLSGWITGGVGAALLTGSLVVGVIAYSKSGELENDCPGRVCPDSRSSDVTSYDTLRTTTFILAGTGAALLVTGIVLTAFSDADGTATAARAWSPTAGLPARRAGALRVTPTGMEVRF